MSDKFRVALNMGHLGVMEKVARSMQIVEGISRNSSVFIDHGTLLRDLHSAAEALLQVYLRALGGARTYVAVVPDYEYKLMRSLRHIAAYVEKVADGNIDIVHLAAMEVKRKGNTQIAGFSVKAGASPGSVVLRTKAVPDVFYKWQYSRETLIPVSWITALITKLSRSTINKLPPGFYWFRVLLVDANGERLVATKCLAVS